MDLHTFLLISNTKTEFEQKISKRLTKLQAKVSSETMHSTKNKQKLGSASGLNFYWNKVNVSTKTVLLAFVNEIGAKVFQWNCFVK